MSRPVPAAVAALAPVTVLALVAALVLAPLGAAEAFMAGNPKAGRLLVVENCTACHAVPDAAAEPAAAEPGPDFAAIAADDRTYTLKSMRKALETPHWKTEKPVLTSKDADNVIAFVLSIRNAR